MSTPFTVERISRAAAKPFIERHHYSRALPGGNSVYFGAFIAQPGSTEPRLYAVAAYGVGANHRSAEALASLTGLPVTKGNLVELKRVCREGDKGAALIPMSAFLSRCHTELWHHGYGPHTGPRKRFIVSYSDPAHSHEGTLYRAANFKRLGDTKPQRHYVDAEGRPVHAKKPHERAKRWNDAHPDLMDLCPMNGRDGAYELGLTPVTTSAKRRWLLDLGPVPRGQPWD